jgi:hypothetical protein
MVPKNSAASSPMYEFFVIEALPEWDTARTGGSRTLETLVTCGQRPWFGIVERAFGRTSHASDKVQSSPTRTAAGLAFV